MNTPTFRNPPDKDQLLKDWWSKWWEADYSWEGLAKRNWVGWAVHDDGSIVEIPESVERDEFGEPLFTVQHSMRQATLQDYWRDMEDSLITSPDGVSRFTPLHLPLRWRDGTPTLKGSVLSIERTAMLGRINSILRKKMEMASEAVFDADRLEIVRDGRAQFQGVVLHALDINQLLEEYVVISKKYKRHLSVRFDGAAFTEGVLFSSVVFFKGTDFRGGNFLQTCKFQGGRVFR